MAKNIHVVAETYDNGFFVTCISYQVSYNKEYLPNWRQHSYKERFVVNYLQQSELSADKVNQFSLRLPELRSTIDMIGNYYHCLYIIMDKIMKSDQTNTGI